MADFKYQRETRRFYALGLDLNRPVDAVKELCYPILKNVRTYMAGRLEPRQGLTLLGVASGAVHSIRRLNVPRTSAHAYVVGGGSALDVNFVQKDTGYSGNPLALVPYRPPQSPDPWMYVADSNKMRKTDVSGTIHRIGLPPPTTAPSAAITSLPFQAFFANPMTTTDWTKSASHVGSITQVTRVNTTITAILYDSGTSGWCTIQPAAMTAIGEGMDLVIASAETVLVHDCHDGSGTTNTIAAIAYESGSSGAASLVLTYPADQIVVNSLLYNSTKAEYARVEAVIPGAGGQNCYRITAPSTWAATNVCYAVPSFRTYTAATRAATNTIGNGSLQVTVDATGVDSFVTYVQSPKFSGGVDLTKIATGVLGGKDDYLHISIALDTPAAIKEGKIMFGCYDTNTPGDAFTKDYYYKTFRVSDLTPNITSAQTIIDTTQVSNQTYITTGSVAPGTTLQDLELLGYTTYEANLILSSGNINAVPGLGYIPNVPNSGGVPIISSPLPPASPSAWTELRFKLSDLIKVGDSSTSGLSAVYYIRLSLTVDKGFACVVYFGSFLEHGGYGLDVGEIGDYYIYRHRARVSTTGVKSNWGPASRGGTYNRRTRNTVTISQYTTATEVDVLDLQRWGGTLPKWIYAGTITNSVSPSFTDNIPDDLIVANDSENVNNDSLYQPWPILGVPVSGTTTSAIGTLVTDSGTGFSTSWAPQTQIEINGTFYTIYKVLSTSKLELFENVGNLGAVTWRVPEPIIQSNALPCLFGPIEEVFFACGDPTNPQRVYWSNVGDADSTSLRNYKDIGSESLMNGLIYNGRAYVFSTERMFQLIVHVDENGNADVSPVEIPNGRGLFSRWAITGLQGVPGPMMQFLEKEGIDATDGGRPAPMTDEHLLPWFPNEGNIGSTVNGIAPPNIVAANAPYLRLNYCGDYLYFDFKDTSGNYRTIAFGDNLMEGRGGWFYDDYTPDILVHYWDEGPNIHAILCGGNDGNIYQMGGNSDNGNGISCQIRTPSRDQGDTRFNKLYGDIMLDCDTGGVSITATPGFNNHSTTAAAVTVSNASRGQVPIPFGADWITARNISLDLQWTMNGTRSYFYTWEPRWTEEGGKVYAYSWETCWITHGLPGFFYHGYLYLVHISSADLTFSIINPNGTNAASITIPASSDDHHKTFMRLPVVKGKIYKYRVTSTGLFRIEGQESELLLKGWGEAGPWKRARLFEDIPEGQVT